jgi:hypothetical protein
MTFRDALKNPLLALVLSVTLGGVALGGWLNMFAAQLAFFLGWIVGLVFLYEIFPPDTSKSPFGAAALLLTMFYLFLGLKARPQAIPLYYGVLAPHRHLFVSPKTKTEEYIEIGDSGAIVHPAYVGPAFIFGTSNLTIESIDGELKVTTDIRNRQGKIEVQLVKNEWKVSPPPDTWDRNYDDDTLEVKDPVGSIVLQIRILADRVQLQGEWWDSDGTGTRIVKCTDAVTKKPGGCLVPLDSKHDHSDSPQIQPLFRYPSELHFGELLTKPGHKRATANQVMFVAAVVYATLVIGAAGAVTLCFTLRRLWPHRNTGPLSHLRRASDRPTATKGHGGELFPLTRANSMIPNQVWEISTTLNTRTRRTQKRISRPLSAQYPRGAPALCTPVDLQRRSRSVAGDSRRESRCETGAAPQL